MVEQDDVAGLLAAEDVATGAHRLEHVAVADGGLDVGDRRARASRCETRVGHHRGDDGVVAQRAATAHGEREHGQDLVAVDELAVGVDRQAPVGVAVVGDARRRRRTLDDRLLQRLEVRRAARRR